MTSRHPAAEVDEQAELPALRDRAEQSRRAVAETADALAGAVAANAHLRHLIRRGAAHLTARISRPWLVIVPVPTVVATTIAAGYLLRRRNGRSPACGGGDHTRAARP